MPGLYDYGFPSDQALIQQALGLARAGVPSRRGIKREYGRAIGDVSGFTKALIGLLRQDDIGGAYAKPLAEEQSARAAAAARLASLGPEYAGADIAAGAAGESGLSLLRANQGAASAYGRKQPGIAGASGALGILGLVNARTDALSKRREDISSNFAARLADVRNQALQIASTNADIDFKQQGLNLDALAAAATGSKSRQSQFWTTRGEVFDVAEKLFEGKRVKVGANLATGQAAGYETVRPHFRNAYNKLWHRYGQELVQRGHSKAKVRKMLRQALFAAGYPNPKKKSSINPGAASDFLGSVFG
jgi:hypothetical protein